MAEKLKEIPLGFQDLKALQGLYDGIINYLYYVEDNYDGNMPAEISQAYEVIKNMYMANSELFERFM